MIGQVQYVKENMIVTEQIPIIEAEEEVGDISIVKDIETAIKERTE